MGLLSILAGLMGLSCDKSNTVHVEFVNDTDGSTIAVSEMSSDQLPNTFRLDTTLELQGQQWSVVAAEPFEKMDFVATGRLRVELAEIKTLSAEEAQNILYSLPTISDELPSVAGETLPHDGLFAIHEDDWRQIEFVSSSFSPQVNQEIADIRRIYEQDRQGIGFKSVHVRARIPRPMPGLTLARSEVESAFPPAKIFEAVSLARTQGTIPLSFAWTTAEGVCLWGQTDERAQVGFLCVSGSPTPQAVESLSTALSAFTDKHDLMFVDWCRRAAYKGQVENFREYFTEREKRNANQKREYSGQARAPSG